MLINPDIFFSIKSDPPPGLLPWLTHQGSLTEKLKETAGEAHLQVIRQVWGKPDWWDRHALKIESEMVMHREIVMWAKKEPCWYARTIIPDSSYFSDTVFFDRLQKESLGKLIFDSSKVRRLMLINYSINPSCIEYYWLTELMHCHEKEFWVRMSGYIVNERGAFFLMEILLPGLTRYIN